MDGLLRTHFSTGNFDGTVGDDLIHVHVGLRTASGLPDAQWELVIQLAGDDFVGGFDDELRNVGREFSQVLIHQRASLLERAEGANQLGRHGVAPNIEMQQRALGLRSPINIRGDFDFAHAVGFGAGLYLGVRGGFGKSRHDEISCASGAGMERELGSASTDIRNRLLYGAEFAQGRGPRLRASRFTLFLFLILFWIALLKRIIIGLYITIPPPPTSLFLYQILYN